MNVKRAIELTIFIWTALIIFSFIWNYTKEKNGQKLILLRSARSYFDLILMARRWNAMLGGVYAPVSKNLKPNPYLNDPIRDIFVNKSLTLTKINPAYMTRLISQIASREKGLKFHITSLKPINPRNKPNRLEAKALKSFRKGAKEFYKFIKVDEKTSFFYMAPLKTETSCLKCHAKQGYKKGDIRGGISIILPLSQEKPYLHLLIAHQVIGLAGILGIVFFGMKLYKVYDTIKEQAVKDSLTGIPNRRSFMERISEEYRRAERLGTPLSVVMCDIDHFKIYNDNYGHDMGDICLKRVAETIRDSLKRSGDFCARYGGEEFIVLLPNTGLSGAIHVAERIRKNVKEMKIEYKGSPLHEVVTISLGVSSTDGMEVDSYEHLIKLADMALYEAKRRGRDQVAWINAKK